MILKLITCILPWPLRRYILVRLFNFEIHPSAKIGISWVYPKMLKMGPNSRIGHFNIVIHIENLVLEDFSTIGRRNWITGFPLNSSDKHFAHQSERMPSLKLGIHSAITKNHHIDCTNSVTIGSYCTIAGYYSQILTHSIDIVESRQDSNPISIGDYCFISTNVVILGGAIIPNYCVIGAKALVAGPLEEAWHLYGGVPAKAIKELPKSAKYFKRDIGHVI